MTKEPVELQAHYITLICQAIAELGGFVRIQQDIQTPRCGNLWVSRSETTTKAEYVVRYRFDELDVSLGVKFVDGRKEVGFKRTYAEGIDEFFPLFMKAHNSNRLTAVR